MAYTTIPKPSVYFDTKLYTGNGGTQNITGVGFEPSFTWIKERAGAEDHALFDAVRGVTKRLISNEANGESTQQGVTAFNSDGVTLGNINAVNENNGLFVSWNWKANGQGSSNSDGSINTTYTSASTTSGFSISTYTGTGANATVGHGLGITPKMFIVKRLNTTGAFRTYHEATGNLGQMALNATDQVSDVAAMWNSTSPTNSTISIGTHAGVNANGGTYVVYCFADVQGYSKMGSYIGNGSADGAFEYLGFKSAWVLIKKASAAESWYLFDNKREGYNGSNPELNPNATNAEQAGSRIDILSNGFKATQNNTSVNTDGAKYIYMAFAGEPLVSTNGNAATAR